MLVAELRKYNNNPIKTQSRTIVLPIKTQSITQDVINIEVKQKQLKQRSLNREFSKIMIGELPAKLRPRYSRAYNIFIQMIELKFALNSLPSSAENDALKIIIHLEKIESERDLIWKEIRHWKNFKTLLPSTVSDFSNLSELQLDKKKRNLKSNINKIEKRVGILYEILYKTNEIKEQRKIELKIHNSEKKIHQHKINIAKINEYI